MPQSRFANPDAVRSPFIGGHELPCLLATVEVRLTGCRSVAVICAVQNSCSWIGLTKNFKVREDDEDEVPRFIPYFGDSTSAVQSLRCRVCSIVPAFVTVDAAFSCNQVGEEAVRLFTNDKLRIKLPVNIVADRVFTVRRILRCHSGLIGNRTDHRAM